MNVQFDLIIPPVIFGFIIIIVLRINSFMMETSVDNQLNYQMQTIADASIILLQDVLRPAVEVDVVTPNRLRFVTTKCEEFEIYQQGRKLLIRQNSPVVNTDEYTGNLDSLHFIRDGSRLRMQVFMESRAEQEAGEDDGNRVRAYAEKQIFMRNIAYSNNPC
ncbi:MAG: hypothetical protein CL666_00560 [Balneola sp.]|nr:hypothetical protein [Balneola sp.]|tara:strand:+ start:38563 stop:39048 length:486 start_codon:yes stop_codon:yes gene_type:complete